MLCQPIVGDLQRWEHAHAPFSSGSNRQTRGSIADGDEERDLGSAQQHGRYADASALLEFQEKAGFVGLEQ